MASFCTGETQVLVATTVIEVGVNVPTATLMIVENAERFGLAQLHQLRGRVGRGKDKSWFILSEKTQEQKERERVASLEQENAALHETVAVLEGQLVDTQLALCDVYEQVLAVTNV